MMKRCFKSIWNYIKKADILLWMIVAAVSVYSLMLLRSVDYATGSSYFRTQLFAILLGVAGAIVISLMDYSDLANFWYLLAGFSIFLMIYTSLFGVRIQGSGGVDARAWINIGGRTFQSSELVKIFFTLTFSKHLDTLRKRDLINMPAHVVLLGCHALVPILLCQLQKDTGAGVVFFAMFLAMSLAAGVKLRYFAVLGVLVLIALPILWQFIMDDYQKLRFIALFNLDDPDIQMGDGYQQYQGMISIGSGRFNGQGLFHGSRVADSRADLAGGHILHGADVSAQCVVHIVNNAGLDHGQSADDGFFSGLEEQFERALLDAILQAASGSQHHGRMRVVTAGVNGAFFTVNRKGQCVHVCAQHHHGAGFGALNNAHDTGRATDAGLHFNT